MQPGGLAACELRVSTQALFMTGEGIRAMSTPLDTLPADTQPTDDDGELMETIMSELKGQGGSEHGPPGSPAPTRDTARPAYYEYDEAAGPPAPPARPPRQQATAGATLAQRIWVELKGPLVAAALFALFSLPLLDRAIARALPRFTTEAGSMNVAGVLIKALVVAIAFYIVSKLAK